MGAIICFDCTKNQSLKSLKQWLKDFREKARVGAPVLIVACKQDLARREGSGTARQKMTEGSQQLILPAGSVVSNCPALNTAPDDDPFSASIIVDGDEEELKLQTEDDFDFEEQQMQKDNI